MARTGKCSQNEGLPRTLRSFIDSTVSVGMRVTPPYLGSNGSARFAAPKRRRRATRSCFEAMESKQLAGPESEASFRILYPWGLCGREEPREGGGASRPCWPLSRSQRPCRSAAAAAQPRERDMRCFPTAPGPESGPCARRGRAAAPRPAGWAPTQSTSQPSPTRVTRLNPA